MSMAVSESSSSALASLALAGFCVNSFLVRVKPSLPIQILPVQAVSIMGGVFSCLPPYEAELYGSRCQQNMEILPTVGGWVPFMASSCHSPRFEELQVQQSCSPCGRGRNLRPLKTFCLLLTLTSLPRHLELGKAWRQ